MTSADCTADKFIVSDAEHAVALCRPREFYLKALHFIRHNNVEASVRVTRPYMVGEMFERCFFQNRNLLRRKLAITESLLSK